MMALNERLASAWRNAGTPAWGPRPLCARRWTKTR